MHPATTLTDKHNNDNIVKLNEHKMIDIFQPPNPEDPLEKQQLLEVKRNVSLEKIFSMIEEMGQRIEPAPHPRPGIQRWYKTDLFGESVVEGNDGTGFIADRFQAELHEQDSAHKIWQFMFSGNKLGGFTQHVWGLVIQSAEGHQLLLSDIYKDDQEPPLSAYVQAGGDQIDLYEESVFYPTYAAVRDFDLGRNPYDEPDGSDYAAKVQDLARMAITIPGISRGGQLL